MNGFRGVADHYNEGSSPQIRPSSPSSLAAAPSSSAESSPSPRLATEMRPALGVGRRVQVVPLLELVLKEVLVRFAVHGVERGQARFHARFRKSLDAARM